MSERVAVAGSGAIACGLAAVVAARLGAVTVLARSEESAQRAAKSVARHLEKLEAEGAVDVTTDPASVKDATVVVEAIAEDLEHKATLLASLADHVADDAIVCTTTSSLSVTELAQRTARPNRFAGLHVFNPVPRMKLIELVVPETADADVTERLEALCEALGKVAVATPDTPGFVVNALLFPYLFHAVRLKDETGMDAEGIDTCMKLGAGMPMGPLGLLDFVGLDVSIAIAEQIGVEVPQTVRDMAAAGDLGKKSGKGFYDYAPKQAPVAS
jgi:3-hydroxybutyryl-CoA dehydrogenase